MDEPKDTKQGTPPEAGQSSGGDTGTTPTEPKTYAEKDVQKAVSDALAKQGRDIKRIKDEHTQAIAARDAATQELEATRNSLASLQSRIDEMELTQAKGDPDMETALRQKRARLAEISALEAQKREALKIIAQAKADSEAVSKAKKEAAIERLSAKYNVEVDWLEGLGVDSVESLTKIAEAAGERKKSKKEPEPEEKKPLIKPDSGGTIGGGEPTAEQLEAMTPEQYAAWASKRFK